MRLFIWVLFCFLVCITVTPISSFVTGATKRRHQVVGELLASSSSPNIEINEFFKRPVPDAIKEYLALQTESSEGSTSDVITLATSPPKNPGSPRPLWLVIVASIPTGLVWYGYYKFCVEEELLQYEISNEKEIRGFGGYGTLGPFCYGLLLGPLASILHLPGGMTWSSAGIIFIYYTQFLLYDRVNEMIREEGVLDYEPLPLWWTLPIFFPFNLIVGLRQVHFLAQYNYRQGGESSVVDPVVEFFPFIGAKRFTWQEFLATPSLWCSLLANVDPIDTSKLPDSLQTILKR